MHANRRAQSVPLDPALQFPVMCLTFGGAGMAHAEQASRLCAAGARWIQLRMKGAAGDAWLREARAAAAACRTAGAVLIVNDSVDVALESGADGVHLGSLDEEWASARRRMGPGKIIGGTVNNIADACRAAASGCLDYVGVGPLRFTATKTALAPVLGLDGIRALIAEMGELPSWAIGGVEASDLADLREAGARGAAVSSALFRGGRVEENLGAFLGAWASRAETAQAVHPS
jgi:thiamine-phosphate pyrophosphorylase